jgi:hypothetical protein
VKEHGEHAHDLVVGDQGKPGEATKPRHARETPVLELGDVGNVRDVLWSPSLHDASAQPLTVADGGNFGHDQLNLGIKTEASFGAKHARHRIRHGHARGRRSQQRSCRSRHRLTDLFSSLREEDQYRQPAEGSEILRAGLRLLIEASVLQTDGRLGGKRGSDRHVFCREAFFTLGADTQRSEHLVAHAKGTQKGA